MPNDDLRDEMRAMLKDDMRAMMMSVMQDMMGVNHSLPQAAIEPATSSAATVRSATPTARVVNVPAPYQPTTHQPIKVEDEQDVVTSTNVRPPPTSSSSFRS